jgi:hypothetical protein
LIVTSRVPFFRHARPIDSICPYNARASRK